MEIFEGFFYLKYKNFTLNTSFKINKNKIISIIGESGSGKSTFLKCVSGIINPSESYLKINNDVIQNSKKKVFIETSKRKIGHVFQFPCLFPNMSVLENIFISKKKTNNYFNEEKLIKLLNLEKLRNRSILNLSGGEKQRISILQIILMKPRLILLDEVFSSQDVNMKKILIELFREINVVFKIPIICVSHDLKVVNNLTKNIIYLNNGKFNYKDNL